MALLKVKGVAAFWGTSERAIWRAIWGGQLSYVRLGPMVRIEEDDMRRWFERQKVASWS